MKNSPERINIKNEPFITGGAICQDSDGLFEVLDNRTGENVYNNDIKFKNLDDAIKAAKIAGTSTNAISQAEKLQIQENYRKAPCHVI